MMTLLPLKSHTPTDNLLAALVAALVFAPLGCGVLYVPATSPGGSIYKPRLVESPVLAYAIPFIVVLCGSLIVAFLSHRRARSTSNRS